MANDAIPARRLDSILLLVSILLLILPAVLQGNGARCVVGRCGGSAQTFSFFLVGMRPDPRGTQGLYKVKGCMEK